MRDEQPGGGAADGSLEGLSKPSAAAQPGERSLDHPALCQHLKAADPIGTFDDLDHPPPQPGEPPAQLFTSIAGIGEVADILGQDDDASMRPRHVCRGIPAVSAPFNLAIKLLQ